MPAKTACPKATKTTPHSARRLYFQVSSPKGKGGTGRSTTVTVPFVWCGDAEVVRVEGRTVASLGETRHGIVALDPDVFRLAHARSVRETTKRNPDWARAVPPKAAPKAAAKTPAKAPRKPAKPSRRSKAPTGRPKGSDKPTAPRGAPPRKIEPTLGPVSAEPTLTPTGAAIAARATSGTA